MATIKKSSMNENSFEGISAVYAVKGGFTSAAGTVDLTTAQLVELPCSEDSGFNYTGGTPSVSHFKVHGQTADWSSRITPGDVEITIEIPTYDDNVLSMLYNQEGKDLTVKLPTDVTIGGKQQVKGKAYSYEQKSILLGLLVINDTEDKALFLKSAKVLATPSFDGSDKPFCVTLTGTLNNGGDEDAMAVLEPSDGE